MWWLLGKSLYILEICLECAGLSANLEIIEAIWIRSKVHSKERLLPEKKLKLNQPGKFKLPGIQYNTIQYNKLYLKYCVNYDLFTEEKNSYKLKKNKLKKNQHC